jgi:hypothetical protein
LLRHRNRKSASADFLLVYTEPPMLTRLFRQEKTL